MVRSPTPSALYNIIFATTLLVQSCNVLVRSQFVCDGLTFELSDARFPNVQIQDIGAGFAATESAILNKVKTDIVQHSISRLQNLNASEFDVTYFDSGTIQIVPNASARSSIRDLVLSCNDSDKFEFQLDHYVFEQVCCTPAPTSSPTACPTVAPTVSPSTALPCQSLLSPFESCPDDDLFRLLGCGERNINVLFLFDMSGSIDEDEFNQMKAFIIQLLEMLQTTRDATTDETPSALVQFAGAGVLEYGFVQGRTLELALNQLKSVVFDQASYDLNLPTNLVGALQYANVLASNSGNTYPTYIILLTDGDDREVIQNANPLRTILASLPGEGTEVIPVNAGASTTQHFANLDLMATLGFQGDLVRGELYSETVQEQTDFSIPFDADDQVSLRTRLHLSVDWSRGLTITASELQQVGGNAGYVFAKANPSSIVFYWGLFSDGVAGLSFHYRLSTDASSVLRSVDFGIASNVADGLSHSLALTISDNEATLCLDDCIANNSTITMPLNDSATIDDCTVESDSCQLQIGRSPLSTSQYYGGTVANLTLCDGVHTPLPSITPAPVSAECSPAPTTPTPTLAPTMSPTTSPTKADVCQSILADEESCVDPQFSPIGRLVCEDEFNLVLLIDASGSINATEYQLAVRYLQTVLILLDETRPVSTRTPTSLLSFDSSSTVLFDFVAGESRSSAFDAISNSSNVLIRNQTVLGRNPGTDMAVGLRSVRDIITSTTNGHDSSLATFVLFISDGVASGSIAEVLAAANELKAVDNVELMTLPVGSTPNGRTLLRTLASSRFLAYTDLFGGFPALLQQVRTTFGQVISDRVFGQTILFDGVSTALLVKEQAIPTAAFSVRGQVSQTAGNAGYLVAKSNALGLLHWGVFISSTRGVEFHYRVDGEGLLGAPGALNRVAFGTATIVSDGLEHNLDLQVGSTEVSLCVDGCDDGATTIVHTLAGVVSDCGNLTQMCVLYIGRQASLDVADATFFAGQGKIQGGITGIYST